MAEISHVCLGAQNVYEAAHRLREETGLASYDGGWFTAGMAVRFVPLGNRQFLEIESLIDPRMAARSRAAEYFGDFPAYLERATAAGDALIGWCVRVDDMDEMCRLAARLGHDVGPLRGSSIRPDGRQRHGHAFPPSSWSWPRGLPTFVHYPDPADHASAGTADHRVAPAGVAWLELGGDEREIGAWLGPEGAHLPLRFAGGAPGIRALAVATPGGELIIRRHAAPVHHHHLETT